MFAQAASGIRLGAAEHVAQRAGNARQVLLDADDLQRVEAIALGHRRLFVPQGADLPGGVEAEPDNHQHRDRQADGQARQGRTGRFARLVGWQRWRWNDGVRHG